MSNSQEVIKSCFYPTIIPRFRQHLKRADRQTPICSTSFSWGTPAYDFSFYSYSLKIDLLAASFFLRSFGRYAHNESYALSEYAKTISPLLGVNRLILLWYLNGIFRLLMYIQKAPVVPMSTPIDWISSKRIRFENLSGLWRIMQSVLMLSKPKYCSEHQ